MVDQFWFVIGYFRWLWLRSSFFLLYYNFSNNNFKRWCFRTKYFTNLYNLKLFFWFRFCYDFIFNQLTYLNRLKPIIGLTVFAYLQLFTSLRSVIMYRILRQLFWLNLNISLNIRFICVNLFHLSSSFSILNFDKYLYINSFLLWWIVCLDKLFEVIRWPNLAIFVFTFWFSFHKHNWSLVRIHWILWLNLTWHKYWLP